MSNRYQTIIIGAGAAGLFCAAQAIKSGSTLVIDHAKRAGEKIRISGGGRCNFTNLNCGPENFISGNPHFVKSALAGYSQSDFIELVKRHHIPFHEKTLGQLFCDRSSTEITTMLHAEMASSELRLRTTVRSVTKSPAGFTLELSERGPVSCRNLVVATGGKSIPKMGASGFGYQLARQFDLPVVPTRAGLVPLTFSQADLAFFKPLAGLSLDVSISCGKRRFEEAMLFTHRGLSGPAILQISSFWTPGGIISINLLPNKDVLKYLKDARKSAGKRAISTVLAELLPNRLAAALCESWSVTGNIADQSDKALQALVNRLQAWEVTPIGSEGYRTAEVTVGGVDTNALNSKTMACKNIHGLYFIGEVVDVTGWLGGYNFQWAWSSAYAAGSAIANSNAT